MWYNVFAVVLTCRASTDRKTGPVILQILSAESFLIWGGAVGRREYSICTLYKVLYSVCMNRNGILCWPFRWILWRIGVNLCNMYSLDGAHLFSTIPGPVYLGHRAIRGGGDWVRKGGPGGGGGGVKGSREGGWARGGGRGPGGG
jgi:hypothetical protein